VDCFCLGQAFPSGGSIQFVGTGILFMGNGDLVGPEKLPGFGAAGSTVA
jgi:hypothetical protein